MARGGARGRGKADRIDVDTNHVETWTWSLHLRSRWILTADREPIIPGNAVNELTTALRCLWTHAMPKADYLSFFRWQKLRNLSEGKAALQLCGYT